MSGHILIHLVVAGFSFLMGVLAATVYLNWRRTRDLRNHVAPRTGWDQ